ncbi:S-layer homology domain-containing protein [Peptoniphilus harei]|uniref:S-layer homology domain-containing protein n=1 Tax=Peptoniphilus TaxID=162289 RepID=UPI002550FC5D|nr:S-layer homology domain-containing protein [Peptoniphilus harei]MDK7377187.1 S-layer homology domain-containing protein [Peptoniphilus harei]MDK7679501.1 S-layer homology domain-containing protein [Peptoniphilus harei]
MNKKIISLVLALVMVLGTFTSVFAETAKADAKKTEETKKTEVKKAEAGEKVEKVVGKDNKIQYIVDKKLVEGYEDGNLGLDKNIKRSEITRLLVLANGNEELAKQLQGSMKIYSDVDVKHWANGVISVGTTVPSDANGIAMLAGYPDGSFKPENDVTYAELAKMLVVLAKKDLTADMVKNAKWATSWMTWAAQLGILDDVNVVDSNKAANRADAFTMVYNALYTMKEFKRVPANETRGIVSNLTNSKLTLNQDSEKEYTITGDTVIVDGINVRKQIVKVNSLNNLDLYKGSLVRILTNDKNEVTHIIELGNPEVLARTDKEGELLDTDNHIWEGVADATVETNYYKNIESLKDLDQKKVDGAYATVTLNGSKTKADYIKFHKANGNELANLKVNDKTEIYVANPYNNIMKEVKDINEALSLIGFHNYGKDYKIPNVYAGFDTDDHKSAVKSFNSERSTAKVIVFNVVSKDNDGDRYRVINSSSSKFSSTLEDTDGKLYDRDNVLNKANFPLNYGDLLDVIETRGDVIDRLLDHSDEKAFPVVKVAQIFDNDEIQVEDRFGNETLLYVGDADIFNAKQYKDLAKGDYLQFTANNKDARDIEIVSILDDTKDTRDLFDKSGSVLNVVQGIEANTVVGTVTKVNNAAYPYTVEVEIEEANWDAGLAKTTKVFEVSKENADLLSKGQNIKFKVEFKKYDNRDWGYDFRLNKAGFPAIKEGKTVLQIYLNDVEKLTPANKVTAENYKDVQKELDYIALTKLSNSDQFKFDNDYKAHADKLAEVKKAVAEKKAEAEKAQAKADLQAKIDEAKAKVKDVKASEDGTEVAKTEKWAKQADIDAINNAITTAEGKLDKTTEEMKQAKTTLQTAIDNFAPKAGTKEA